jgi:hypothetical protein
VLEGKRHRVQSGKTAASAAKQQQRQIWELPHVVPWHDAAQVRAHGVQAEVLDLAVVGDDEVRRVRLQAMHNTSIQQSGTEGSNKYVLALTSASRHD